MATLNTDSSTDNDKIRSSVGGVSTELNEMGWKMVIKSITLAPMGQDRRGEHSFCNWRYRKKLG